MKKKKTLFQTAKLWYSAKPTKDWNFSSVMKEGKWDNLHNGQSNLGQRPLDGTQALC